MEPERFQGLCKSCGEVVWESLHMRRLPTFTETITCPVCGTDNSISPTFRQRWRTGVQLLRKRARSYGWITALCMGNPFKLERERKQAGHGNSTETPKGGTAASD